MHTWGSGRFLGIDRDARHIATTIVATYEDSVLPLAAGH
jgi:putative flavoprotein involved in K+ transport